MGSSSEAEALINGQRVTDKRHEGGGEEEDGGGRERVSCW